MWQLAPSWVLGDEVRPAGPGNSESGWHLVAARTAAVWHAAHGDSAQTAAAVAAAAVRLLPDVDAAAVCGLGRRRATAVLSMLAATDPVLETLCAVQLDGQGGPDLVARQERRAVVINDVGVDGRWPAYAAAASAVGVVGAVAVPLWIVEVPFAVLSLYRHGPAKWAGQTVAAAQVFGMHAAVALDVARERDDLWAAVEHRDVIGQAKGILMQRDKITAEDAFAVLTKVSQDVNLALWRVAEQLTLTGSLPEHHRRLPQTPAPRYQSGSTPPLARRT